MNEISEYKNDFLVYCKIFVAKSEGPPLKQSNSILVLVFSLSPGSSVGSVQDLKTGGRSLDPGFAQFLSEDSHCDRINSSPTVDHCFDDGLVRK